MKIRGPGEVRRDREVERSADAGLEMRIHWPGEVKTAWWAALAKRRRRMRRRLVACEAPAAVAAPAQKMQRRKGGTHSTEVDDAAQADLKPSLQQTLNACMESARDV